jgi:hypothetical protein
MIPFKGLALPKFVLITVFVMFLPSTNQLKLLIYVQDDAKFESDEPEFGRKPNPHHAAKPQAKPSVPGRDAVQISSKNEDMLVDLLKNIVRICIFFITFR